MRTLLIVSILFGFFLFIGQVPNIAQPNEELVQFSHDTFAIQFPSADACSTCHGSDIDGIASTTSEGKDINVIDDWLYSMKALAGQDPLWKAQMAYEVHLFDTSAIATCFQCHIPATYQLSIKNGSPIEFSDLEDHPMIGEGVNCSSCHQIDQFDTINGFHNYMDDGTIKGPYQNPFAGPMNDLFGWPVVYDPVMRSSTSCKSCHTILHNRGGKIVPEQTTYLEWAASSYASDQKECQQCHMPYVFEPIKLATEYPFLEGRIPFAQHSFAGANSYMIEAILSQLGTDSVDEGWTEKKEEHEQFLRDGISIQFNSSSWQSDHLEFSLLIRNLAGHKNPSGYPSRKLFVETIIRSPLGDTLFHNGHPESVFQLTQPMPHFDTIKHESEYQIYEYLAESSGGTITSSLHAAENLHKDNRLPPKGFMANDTIAIIGHAINDADFSLAEGSDILHYKLPSSITTSTSIEIISTIWYMNSNQKWLSDLTRSLDSIANQLFSYAMNQKPYLPLLTKNVTLTKTSSTSGITSNQLLLSPNPALRSTTIRSSIPIQHLTVMNASGQQIQLSYQKGTNLVRIPLSLAPGTYWFLINHQYVHPILVN